MIVGNIYKFSISPEILFSRFQDEGDQDFKGQFDVSHGFCDGWNSGSLQ